MRTVVRQDASPVTRRRVIRGHVKDTQPQFETTDHTRENEIGESDLIAPPEIITPSESTPDTPIMNGHDSDIAPGKMSSYRTIVRQESSPPSRRKVIRSTIQKTVQEDEEILPRLVTPKVEEQEPRTTNGETFSFLVHCQ